MLEPSKVCCYSSSYCKYQKRNFRQLVKNQSIIKYKEKNERLLSQPNSSMAVKGAKPSVYNNCQCHKNAGIYLAIAETAVNVACIVCKVQSYL